MESINRLESAMRNEAAERERTIANLAMLKEQITLLNDKSKPRRQQVQLSLANKQARPLVDIVADCQNMAIRDLTNRLRITPTQSLVQTKPQLYSPRKSRSAKFEKAETRMLRSYLEKNDEFVDEETFLGDMINKFGPKILQSYPELWNERIECIEKIRAETNLHIKESENIMTASMLAEKENKIDQLNLDEIERLEENVEVLQKESDKAKAQSKSLIEELTDERSIQNDLYNLMVLTAEKEILSSIPLPSIDTPIHADTHGQFINLKTEKKKLLSLIKKKTERLSRFSGQSGQLIDMLAEARPKAERSSSSRENDIKRWETSLVDLKTNLCKVPPDQKDKYSDMTSSTKTFESVGEIIARNEFNDVCNLGPFNVLLNRVGLGISDLENQNTKISKRIRKQKKEVKAECESIREMDFEKVVNEVKSCHHENKNLNTEKNKIVDAVFQTSLTTAP